MRSIVCDLDGVVWRGSDPVPGSAEAIASLRAAGRRVGFVTNNSGRPRAEVIAQLATCGIPAEPIDVVTSADAAVACCRSVLPGGSRIFACAGQGVVSELSDAGFAVTRAVAAAQHADAVVVGWHRDFDFERLAAAADVARRTGRLIATNTDPTYPAEGERVLPGSGAIVVAVATASGVVPVVAGKPEEPTAKVVRDRFGPQGIIVGDRPTTDGLLAVRLGWPFALVFSGITQPGDDLGDPAPALAGADLAALAAAILAI